MTTGKTTKYSEGEGIFARIIKILSDEFELISQSVQSFSHVRLFETP